MADIVLVQPKVGEWDFVRTKPAMPLALLHAAALADIEYEIKLIDQRTDGDWENNLRHELEKKPLCFGTTAFSGSQIHYALAASKVVKESDASIPVVWGGVHATLLTEQTLRNENIDIVVRGEGESTFYELVKALDGGRPQPRCSASRGNGGGPLDGIMGIWYKRSGSIRSNPDRDFLDLDTLPDIPYHLVDVKKYLPMQFGMPTLYMQTSRGCPHRCTYCYNAVFNMRKWRPMSAEKTAERIADARHDFGVKNFYFVDDNFFTDLKRAREIAERITELDVKWQVQGVCVSDVDKMDDGYLRAIEKSGCLQFRIGAESGSQRILEMIKKKTTVEQIKEVNRKLVSFNIAPYYHFLCGYPGETLDELRKSIELAFLLLRENPRARISPLHCFTPEPGTEMYELAVNEGFIPPAKLEGWTGTDRRTAYNPKNKELLEGLNFVSLFIDKKSDDVASPLIRLFAKFYRPIARYRMEKMFFRFMVEKKMREWYLKARAN
jgi:radical SAM superfamily enzyme YgiQ (UPF0313 family)